MTTANSQSYWTFLVLASGKTAANRLQNTTGPWGATTNYYDGVGNRTYDISTPSGGATTTRVFAYPAGSNRLSNVKIGTTTERTFVHDAAGNITSDTRSGTAYVYAYNKRNRLGTVTVGGSLKSTYTPDRFRPRRGRVRGRLYNGLEQVAIRVLSNMTPSGTTHFIYDRQGNLIAETAGGGATGATGTVREYIYLPALRSSRILHARRESAAPSKVTEIAPTLASRTVVDRPVAVVNAVNTTPVIWQVHVDHLNRPIRMTDAAKASVWDVVWAAPWFACCRRTGNVYSISGTATLDARFPGQWYQLESGLHYNWHRHYDPTLGRYTQPDPLGFVDGPSVYGYAGGNSQAYVDQDGRFWNIVIGAGIGFGLDLTTQLILNGGSLECVNLGQLLTATGFGALGGALGGAGLPGWLSGLSISTKQKIGEGLSIANNYLKGSSLLATNKQAIIGFKTRPDSTWSSIMGNIYYFESKFGNSRLRPAQLAAAQALGDRYVVERWGYDFFGRIGAYLGGAAAAVINQGGVQGCDCR